MPLRHQPSHLQRSFLVYAHNDMHAKVNALPAHPFGRLQSASGEEMRPFFGRTLMTSILDQAFKGKI